MQHIELPPAHAHEVNVRRKELRLTIPQKFTTRMVLFGLLALFGPFGLLINPFINPGL